MSKQRKKEITLVKTIGDGLSLSVIVDTFVQSPDPRLHPFSIRFLRVAGGLEPVPRDAGLTHRDRPI